MKTMLLATVREFFRQKAGLFLVVLGIVLGFFGGAEHRAFATFFLTDPNGIFYRFGIWLAYTLFCAQFVANLWQRPEYAFIYEARLWPPIVQAYRFGSVAIGLLQPVIGYGLFLIGIAFQINAVEKLRGVAISFLILIALLSASLAYRIRNQQVVIKNRQPVMRWPFRRRVSWIGWTIEWLFREKGITILTGKVGAMLAAMGTMLYFSTDDFDIRMPAVGLSFAYLLNAGISYELYRWETETWLWGRSLPFSAGRRWGRIVVLHALILLPETAILLRSTLSIFEIMQLYAMGVAMVVLLHLYFYKKSKPLEDSTQVILIAFIVLTFLILYKIPLILIAGGALLFALLIYPKWYRM